MITLLLSLALGAEPFAGAAIRPFSRADLVWVQEGRTSGESVGEFDGVVRPGIQPYVGAWFSPRIGLLGSVGVASLSTSTFIGDNVSRRSHTVVRPSIDLRVALRPESPTVWTVASVHADIPSAVDRSTVYTDEEQEAADIGASNTRSRLGGVGGALGAGVDVSLVPELSVGIQYRLELHRGSLRNTTAVTTSTWLASDASLLITVHWPRPKQDEVPADVDASP
ncbi:MAG: hypothetical protein ACJATT_001105 [Myxococcota bacterium]|jgi:hypothetical protein